MEGSCGAYEAVIDARGLFVTVGLRFAGLIGLGAAELTGRPASRWLRGGLLTGAPGVPVAGEVRSEQRGAIACIGVKLLTADRTTVTIVPEPARSEVARARDPEARFLEVGREIQDALTGIMGFAGLVQLAPTPHRRKFYVDQAISQSHRVRRLVQMLDPAPAGRAPFVRPADLGEELSRVLSGLRATLEKGGIAFDFEAPEAPVWAACDVRQVGDMVTALIQRATVQQRRDYLATEVVLMVKRGHGAAGIELLFGGAEQPHVLLRESFGTEASNGDSELRTAFLALQRQGGELVIKRDTERQEVRLVLSVPAVAAPRRADKLRTPVPLEVLVVDDDAMLGDLYQEMLGVSGHTVVACRTIGAAREALKVQRFDVVVAEFQLKDGLLSELWAMASEAHPELASRLIVATRDARDARLLEWASRQDTPILAKPFVATALNDLIALLVSP